jgi:predicted CopG family antitoxin
MKLPSLSEIKKELKALSPEEGIELCLKLAKYKRENKELLNYLLFESHDEAAYVNKIKEEVAEEFEGMNTSNWYLAKKSIRRILRILKKHIKYSGKKETEVELLMFFCMNLKESSLKIKQNLVLANIYQRQIAAIHKAISTLHEDLQYDYQQEIEELERFL